MSSNRLIYDVETFNEYTDANAKHLAYTEYKGNFVNDSRCGTEMPLGDRAKIENMLTGRDRKASKAVGSCLQEDLFKNDGKAQRMGYSTPDACNITFGHIASCNHNQKMPKDNGLGQKKLAKMAKDLAEERERNNNQ
tara:strand:+ start:73 stop:483 length:411 start_codon:yes stop_codon:yes gene_type:complete